MAFPGALTVGHWRAVTTIGLGCLFLLYVLAIDQGQLLSLIQGSAAFDQTVFHETLHDARHAAGFPCH